MGSVGSISRPKLCTYYPVSLRSGAPIYHVWVGIFFGRQAPVLKDEEAGSRSS